MNRLLPLLEEVRACRLCEPHLPLGPRPVVQAGESARLLIVGQAPGTRVHESGIPWNDPSGDRLRDWLQLDKAAFYDERRLAIIPMGFCYPGRGKGGDLPPRQNVRRSGTNFCWRNYPRSGSPCWWGSTPSVITCRSAASR